MLILKHQGTKTPRERDGVGSTDKLGVLVFQPFLLSLSHRPMRLTLRQLEVFVAIARDGNVTHAADKIAMSQSAASTALGELEKQFGRPLFDRVGKRLHLNEVGQAAMPKALEILDRAAELEALLAD